MQAEQLNISMEIKVALPKELPVDAFELSIVFANALENAIQAVKGVPEEQRRIICKSVMYPRFMIEIANTYTGEITFDRHGVPLAEKLGHGIGIRRKLSSKRGKFPRSWVRVERRRFAGSVRF